MAPTAAGELVLRHARTLLAEEKDLRAAVAGLRESVDGPLDLVASTIPAAHLLPGPLRSFMELHPGLRPRVHSCSSREAVDRLLAGLDEIALVGHRFDLPRLEARPLCEDELVLVVPSGHGLARRSEVLPEDLASAPLLVREDGSGTRGAVERWFREGGVDPERLDPVAFIASSEALRAAVVEGLGVAILSSFAARPEIRAGRLVAVPLAGGGERRRFWAVREKGRCPSPAAAAFFEHLLRCFRAEDRR